ncbi:LysR family transcriptional regulator [Bacillus sp. AFS017336]|uniref:LysR family transcriptional regulator n=1 Tax=Bacillus sp. AFS017336 TaxID=2033489 RepID=UPI000BEFC42F|nr:LysR family transcriptional regulator [Bacillus sp. AFS017336]PEL08373.1 hypothetical protein CN601_16755 [Bacillus sp. AFS017336]
MRKAECRGEKMNFEQMEYIITIANEMSITKAAEKFFISPSGMSQSITQLENELGIKIFNRSKHGVTQTLEGKIVISKAKILLKTIKDLNKEIDIYKSNNKSQLKILTAPTFSYSIQELLVKFNMDHKNISIEIVEQNPADIIQNFNKHNYDIAFIPATIEELKKASNIKFEHLHRGHICIAVGKKSPFYSMDYVAPRDLIHAKTVVYKNSDYRRLLKIAKMDPKNIVLKSNRSSLLFELVKESQAIFYLHDFTAKNRPMVLNGDIKIVPLKEENFFEIDFWFIYLEMKGLTPEAREFIKELKNSI